MLIYGEMSLGEGEGTIGGVGLLMVNPVFLKPEATEENSYQYQFRGIRGNFEPEGSVGKWRRETHPDEPPYSCGFQGYYFPFLAPECGSTCWSDSAGDPYERTWCAMLKRWATRVWSAWSNDPFPVQRTQAHCIIYQYLLALGDGRSTYHEYHFRMMSAQKYRVPYHALHPDLGEILENVTCAVALAKFDRNVHYAANLHYLFSPSITCKSSGVARVIHENEEDDAVLYGFGDVSHLFNGSEFIKVEYHPDESILPTLLPYEGAYRLDYSDSILAFENEYPQIMVIP